MRIRLWTGDTLPTTRETFDIDARAALAAWMQDGDCIRRFNDQPLGATVYYVYTEGEHTDAFAMVLPAL